MIKFDKVTLEPKFIDPSMCFCNGGGGPDNGGNAGNKVDAGKTGAISRGTIGLSRADMNRRADAQERGSREVANLSAGISDNISSGFGRSPRGEVAGGLGDYDTGDDFVTSTEGAYRDLDRRAAVGQMPNISQGLQTPLGRVPTPTSVALGALNKFGMNRAQDIRGQLSTGGVPVTDRFGRIQGVVSEGTGPVADLLGAFGQNRNVYTGGSGFAPSTSQLMSYSPKPSGIASLPEAGSVFELDGRSFLSTVNGPIELKGTAEQNVVGDFGLRSGATLDNPVLSDKDLTNPSYLDNVPLQGVPDGIDLRTGMPNFGPQPQNVGLFGEDPRAAGFRDLGNNIQSIINNEPLPDDQNMYGPGMPDFGLNYKIDIAQQDPQTYAQNQALANQNMAQLEYPTIEDRGSLYGRSFDLPVRQRSLYEGFADPMSGITLGDIAGPNPIVSLSDLSDSANFGNPYAGTTGGFVPTKIEVDAQGRSTIVPVGFGAGGVVSLIKPATP